MVFSNLKIISQNSVSQQRTIIIKFLTTQALLQEAVQQKVVLEELNDRCEILMELSACNWVRDQTVQQQSTYTNLLTAVQVTIHYTYDSTVHNSLHKVIIRIHIM